MTGDLRQFTNNATNAFRTTLYYVASPYSHDCPEVVAKRVQDATRAADAINLNYNGVTAYSPVAAATGMQARGITPKEGWYLYDFAMLSKADRLIVLKLEGWETSIGVSLEIAFALGKGIPITYWTLAEALSDELPF